MAENGKKDIRTNNIGATHDIDLELSGNQNTGKYFDSENGRVSSQKDKGSWKKIKGNALISSNSGTGQFFCMCSISINGDLFEIWTEKTNSAPPKIIINGTLMGESVNMPWLYAHRIQWDKNENCIGGEIYLTDFNVPPMILNLKDIKDNFTNGTQKYFADFNPELYYINLNSPLDIPVFKELVDLGSGAGLPVGSYQYSIRYSNDEGDKTNWSVLTPPIPVLESVDKTIPQHRQYYGAKAYGNKANLLFPTRFGVRIRYRVTNISDYKYIEIRRIGYNSEAGIDTVPQGQLIAKIDILPGEISIRDFIDPVNSNVQDTLADNEELFETSTIERAKGIRYHDKKLILMNFETSSKETTANIQTIGNSNQKIIPVSKHLGKLGFNDPVNHTYNKNYQSNEKYSFGVAMFDGGGGAGFVFEDANIKNIQAPSRRDKAQNESLDLSIGRVPVAATVDSTVDFVFEVFDHEDAIGKSNTTTIRNITNSGSKNGTSATVAGYVPLRPVNKNDVTTDYNYRINTGVRDSSNNLSTYDPECFRLDYFSRGFALGGLLNLPPWVKAFSVVRSKRADRVVCQGIGMYSMISGHLGTGGGSGNLAEKVNDKFWFHSPDIQSGIVDQSIIQDISSNPQNYQIQLVSPLGFFSELYNFNNRTLLPNRDRLIDMISYARVLHDEGQINPNEDSSMGVGSGGKRYVAYNRYRNISDPAGGGAFNTTDGNRTFNLSNLTPITDGRGTYYEMQLAEQIYARETVTASSVFLDNDFDDAKMKDWTEPWYIVNILQSGKQVQDNNINPYVSTGHYQKLESIIGEGNGANGQSFVLVDERWEDCIPALLSTDFNAGGESFITVRDSNGQELLYYNVTHLPGATITAIEADILSNGFYTTPNGIDIVGIYTHSINGGDISVDFSYPAYNPPSGSRIIVKYDPSRPTVFFGGDTVVGENIFAPIDREAEATNADNGNTFVMNIGFPYRRYDFNTNYFIFEDLAANNIQSSDNCRIGYVRQLCIMYAAESVTASQFSFNLDFPLAHFPLTHYIMRPNKFDDSNFGGGDPSIIAIDNDLFPAYFDDYPREWELWKFGGFRFLPQYNYDYSVKGPTGFFSKPDIGFKEDNKFCTGVTWSLTRAINQQDSPGLKTFLPENRYLADDDAGAIVKAYDATTSRKGSNLYGICKGGIVLFLTKKAILSNIDADDLTVTGTDRFISGEYWISREVGSNGEMWRGMAEASIDTDTQSGKVKIKALFIPNSDSVYMLMENMVLDIAKDTYLSRIQPSLEAILPAYQTHIVGHYDEVHEEYWLQMPDQNEVGRHKCFVYCNETKHWIGRFTYSHDSYVNFGGNSIGLKNLSRFRLNEGFTIDNLPITAYLIQHTSIELVEEKEFISIEVNTGPRGTMKPTEIIFMDENQNELCRLNQSLFGTRYLKQYNGWWNQIPRKEISASPNRDRVQYRLLLYKIIHTFGEEFKIVTSVIEYKNLK